MNIAEEHVPQDETTELSPDESSIMPDGQQDKSSDLAELYSLLEEPSSLTAEFFEAEVSIEDETSLDDETSDFSAPEEQYSVPDDASYSVSVLEELEAMYGRSDEEKIDDSENIYDDVSDGDNVLKELEALLDNPFESATDIVMDEVDDYPETVAYSSAEEDVNDISALDELKIFLDEIPSHESSKSIDAYTDDDSYLFENRRSILDELQTLLQSSIDELKASADGKTGASLLSIEAEYPTRDELEDLLESKLSQLIMISDGSASFSPGEGASVLDELSALLGETDSDAAQINRYSPVSSYDEQVLPATSEYDSDEVTDVDSVLKEFEHLLPELAKTEESEVIQDPLLTSVNDSSAENRTEDASILEELEAYYGALPEQDNSELQDVDTENSGSTSNALEQLEAMLAETAGSENNRNSETIEIIEDDFIDQKISSPLPAEDIEEKDEDSASLSDDDQIAAEQTDRRVHRSSVAEINLLPEAENNKRLPIVFMFSVISAVVAVIYFWNMPAGEDGLRNNLPATQTKTLEKSVIFKTGSRSLAQAESVSAFPSEVDNIDDLLASIESSGYEKKSIYEEESSTIEMDISQLKQPEVNNEIATDRLIEPINQQTEYVQNINDKSMDSLEESVGLLSERMIEAESSISRLQHALEKSEQSTPVQTVVSTVNDGDQVNQKHDENEKNIGLLNKRVIDAESSISNLQHTIEQAEQLEPVQSVTTIASKMNAVHQSKEPVSKLNDQTYDIWSVHLFSYYGKPPPAGELEFLDIAGVPYQIEKAIVNDGVWYRVLVNNSSEYLAAKQYAEMLKKRLAIKKIWISKKQYSYD